MCFVDAFNTKYLKAGAPFTNHIMLSLFPTALKEDIVFCLCHSEWALLKGTNQPLVKTQNSECFSHYSEGKNYIRFLHSNFVINYMVKDKIKTKLESTNIIVKFK